MYSSIFNFITKFNDKIAYDGANKIRLILDIPVNEIDDIEFPNYNGVIKYSILYRDTSFNGMQDFLDSFKPVDHSTITSNVKITVIIDKKLIKLTDSSNCVFFSNILNFKNSLCDINIDNIEEKLIVLILNEDICFESKFIKIISKEELEEGILESYEMKIENDDLKIFQKLNTLFRKKELENYLKYPLTWISIDGSTDLSLLNNEALLCFFSIISNSIVSEEDIFIIRGYKTVSLTIDKNDKISNNSCQIIGDMTKFIIDEQRSQDKLIILRNTLTLYMNTEESVDGLESKFKDIKKSMDFNFNLYIQDKVKLFLDQKNKLLHEFISTTKKIEDLTNNLINQMRTISLSLLGTIFLSLLNDLNKGSSRMMINIVLLSYIFFFLLNLIIVVKQNKQKEALIISLKNYTKTLGVIDDSHDDSLSYKKLKKDYLDNSLNFFTVYREWTMIGLSVLIVIFIFMYLNNRFNIFPLITDALKFIVGY